MEQKLSNLEWFSSLQITIKKINNVFYNWVHMYFEVNPFLIVIILEWVTLNEA
jgi:hypothetical protein